METWEGCTREESNTAGDERLRPDLTFRSKRTPQVNGELRSENPMLLFQGELKLHTTKVV